VSVTGAGLLNRIYHTARLVKFRLLFLVVASAAAGFLLAPNHPPGAFFNALLGTALMASGSLALNQWMERRSDARMPRTALRPLPRGKISPAEAFAAGSAMTLSGAWLTLRHSGATAAALSVLAAALYLAAYTPLKKRSPACLAVGAAAGALPPLIGWTAAGGSLDRAALSLFGILFFWQILHFGAIAWIYRKQYAEAGFRLARGRDDRQWSRIMTASAVTVLMSSLLPFWVRLTGEFYFFSSLAVGTAMIALTFLNRPDNARLLARASVAQLTALWILMALDKA
jgi:protoheme IX farnesyltransferase